MSELILEKNVASLEYDFAGVREISQNLYKGLSLYVRNMSMFLNKTLAELNGEAVGFQQNPTLNKYVDASNYINMAEVALPVPTGLNTSMLEYLEALEVGQSLIDQLVEKTLNPAHTWFSILLTSPENLASISGTNKSSGIELFEKQREQAVSAVSKCFLKNDRIEFMRYGDLYKRNKDFLTAQDVYEGLSARLIKTSPKTVRSKVESICEILDKLALKFQQNKHDYETSGVTAKRISDIAYGLAQCAEFYASHFYLMQSLTSCLDESNKRLQKVV